MPQSKPLQGRRIGFVSTRFAGTDGVSLETAKWALVLERLGHTCFYFAGESDRPPERTRLVPEAHFSHPEIASINATAFAPDWQAKPDGAERVRREPQPRYRVRPPKLTDRIRDLARHLETELYAFVREFDLELLIVQNALAIPMNLPLGVALVEFIAETGLPIIAHHHDFFWERQRFLVSCVDDYLRMAFPPVLPGIRHVVINTAAAQELSRRAALAGLVVPNVMDFDNPPPPPDEYAQDVRAALGLAPGEHFILQPTRIVQRKGIEHAIELTRRLGLPARLVVSHASGDEGDGYERHVRNFAALLNVPVNFVADIISEQRGRTADGRKIYSLGDVYPHADLVTYPSTIEGFGNAFLEAVYFRRPIVVNNYSIFNLDIKPKGFRVVEFDGYISEAVLEQTCRVLESPALAQEMAEVNYQLARRHYSYSMLERPLETLIAEWFGEEEGNGP
jgi:glycosyltransferase involved in cell wall biosynthesis